MFICLLSVQVSYIAHQAVFYENKALQEGDKRTIIRFSFEKSLHEDERRRKEEERKRKEEEKRVREGEKRRMRKEST